MKSRDSGVSGLIRKRKAPKPGARFGGERSSKGSGAAPRRVEATQNGCRGTRLEREAKKINVAGVLGMALGGV